MSRGSAQWLEQLSADGTVTKLVRRGDAELLGQAGAVLAQLPVREMSLPVLAERATGNTKALSQTALATLVLRALALRDGLPAPATSAERRLQWESAGVILDDLASQVLVLGVRPIEDNLLGGLASAGRGRRACRSGSPCSSSPRTLSAQPVRRSSCARTRRSCALRPHGGALTAGHWCAARASHPPPADGCCRQVPGRCGGVGISIGRGCARPPPRSTNTGPCRGGWRWTTT